MQRTSLQPSAVSAAAGKAVQLPQLPPLPCASHPSPLPSLPLRMRALPSLLHSRHLLCAFTSSSLPLTPLARLLLSDVRSLSLLPFITSSFAFPFSPSSASPSPRAREEKEKEMEEEKMDAELELVDDVE